MNVIFAQLVLAAGLRLAGRTASPVEKVVELINELKAKIETDGANEQKIYDKFACWCETTTKRKANNIDDGKALIGTATTAILELKGAVAVLEHEVSVHEADIEKNNNAMKKLSSIREKENSDFQQDKSYMETTLSSLHQAIEVLGGAGTKKMSTMEVLKVAAKVRSAVVDSPQLNAMSVERTRLLKAFLESPADYYDKKAQAKASYSPQSATVQGILKDMYDTFSADLEKSNAEESTAQKNFEDIFDEKNGQNKLLQAMVTTKEATKAEKMQSLTDNESLLAATQEQLKTDEEFFATATDSCKEKSDSWDERCRLRTEELDGIQKALAILTSDDARETFANSTSSRPVDTFGSDGLAFVQMSSPAEKAYRALKKVVGHSTNLRLARLAVSIRTATTGHFDEVIASVDTMLQNLKDEAAKDVEQRDWCIAEQHKENMNRDGLEYQISQLAAKIKRAETKKAGLETDKQKTLDDKASLQQDMAEALEDRTRENAAFENSKADDLKAIALLGDAIAALSEYGMNNAFVQRRVSFKQEPVFEVSEDQAPDATFSVSGEHSGASNGIVQMITHIKENLENEVQLGSASEAKASAEYNSLETNANAQIEAYDKQVTGLDAQIALVDETITTTKTNKEDTEGEHTATVEYLARINPNCEWIIGAFTKRADARKAESDGLMQAKATLAGAMGEDYGFLQRVQ
jgi:hypothetical protein